jgi:putative redox protein
MPSERFDFTNDRGLTLSGRLELPEGPARAFALFAHCFSCAKTNLAAVRVSRVLAGMGIGVLRFDFTGLGGSEGEFARGGFSGDVADVVSAARAMAGSGRPVSLLVGHSLGGAAVLAAAAEVPDARAVAVIAAPAQPVHVLGQLGEDLARVEAEGEAEVHLGGRPFTVTKSFVDDVRMHDLHGHIAHLGRALLVLHSPVDETVPASDASTIFLAARHPKSFVSLDHADHLLTRPEDADYAGRVIAAWASRYIGVAPAAVPAVADGVVLAEETGAGKFQVEIRAGAARLLSDEPVEAGGLGSGLNPHQLVSAGLAACTAMTARLYAERKAWPLDRTRVAVRHDVVPSETPSSRFDRRIAFEGPLDPTQVARLFEIADKCPVHRTLEAGAKIVTSPMDQTPSPTSAAEDAHFREMDATCRKEGA